MSEVTTQKTEKQKIRLIDLNPVKKTEVSDQFDLEYSLTDYGNACRIVDTYGDRLVFIHEMGKFALFDGNIFQIDHSGSMIHKIYEESGRQMVQEALKHTDRHIREALFKWCKNSEFYKVYSATKSHLEKMTAINLDEFDNDDYSINTLSGIICLKSFKVRPATPQDKNLKQVEVKYSPESQAPRFNEFMIEITSKAGEPRPELAKYLHKMLGYALLGDTSEKCIFFFYGGAGDNGKSTLINFIEWLLGPYAARINSGSLMKKFKGDEKRNDLAKLIGCRFVAGSETGKGQQFDDGLLRDLVGGDSITCRYLRREFFTYTPIYKLFLYGNNKPRLDADDPAIRKKIKLIPFDFQPTKVDNKLKFTLRKEAEGIFNWLVQGLKLYYEEGLAEPAEISETTTNYFNENDWLASFLHENFETGGPDDVVTKSRFYEQYRVWAEGENHRVLSKSALSRRLKDKGYADNSVKLHGKTERVWIGLKSSNQETGDPDALEMEFS